MNIRCELILDSQNRIADLDKNWDEQLLVPIDSMLAKNLVGQPYFNFISGDPTQLTLSAMLQFVRVKQESSLREYRCDAPFEARWCSMEVSPLGGGEVRITHDILRTEKLQKPYGRIALPESPPFGNASHKRVDKILRCSFCCKFKWGHAFVTPTDYSVLAGMAVEEAFDQPCRYIICDECMQTTHRNRNMFP